MKLDPHLPSLPSLAELLEHPRVKNVVARINRSTLAHRASGFLEELRANLAERAGRVEMPSVAQLAERLARRLVGDATPDGPLVNATGVVVGDPRLTPPLADAAVHAVIQVLGDYYARGGEEIRRRIDRDLCSLTGADASLTTASFEAALSLAIASAAGREILVVPGSADEAAIDWPRWAARAGVVLRTSAGDGTALAAAIDAGRPAVLVRSPTAAPSASTRDLATLAKRCGAAFIDVAPWAGVLDPQTFGLPPVETLRERIAAGADLVITDGAGLLGGPACGILVGKSALVEPAAAHQLAAVVPLDAAGAAALHTTLSLYRDDADGGAALAIPVWQLLSAPRANLTQRGERLAALIAASPAVAATRALAATTPWLRTGRVELAGETTIIAVEPKSGDAAALADRLRLAPHGIAATAVGAAVHLDLRSVFPRWDQHLVAAFADADG